jgi:hypothetical protein
MGVFSPTAESLPKFTRAFYADSFYLTAQPPQTRLRHPGGWLYKLLPALSTSKG